MSRWADVTLKTGESFSPVKVHDDGRGVRFYAYSKERGGIFLLASVRGARVTSWGEKRRGPDGKRIVLPVAISGDLPESFETMAYRGGCQCSHALKNYGPPRAWEEVEV